MTANKYYIVEKRAFLGRLVTFKSAGEPIVKSVNGGTQRVLRQVEISEDEFLRTPLNDLIAKYLAQKEESNAV